MSDADRAFFLVIEGLDGSGKSEISRRLAGLLRETLDDRVMLTFEPHDPSAAGLFIRQALTRRIETSPRALALAYALNRADHNFRVINPFLDGAEARPGGQRIVICDRYVLSSLVYQSVSPLTMDDVWALNAGVRPPDLVLFMDASAATCYRRLGQRGGERELFDTNLAARREQYRRGLDYIQARGQRTITVDANPDLIDVLNGIIDLLNQHGPAWLTMQRLLLLEDVRPPLDVVRRVDAAYVWSRATRTAEATGAATEDALAAEINALLPAEAAGLGLHALALAGCLPRERLPYEDAPLYRAEVSLPAGIMQSGAALLLPETGRYDLITRAIQFLERPGAGDPCTFLIAFDPGPADAPLRQFVREGGTPLSRAVRVIGRQFLIERILEARPETQPA